MKVGILSEIAARNCSRSAIHGFGSKSGAFPVNNIAAPLSTSAVGRFDLVKSSVRVAIGFGAKPAR